MVVVSVRVVSTGAVERVAASDGARFWEGQVDELRERPRIERLLADVRAAVRVHDGLGSDHGLDPVVAAAAAADTMAGERSVHAAMCGNPSSTLMNKMRWLDMLRQAAAQGAKRMVVLDFRAVDGVHADVDVELALVAAQLDVLDALAPLVRHEQIVEQTKTYLHERALKAMADRDNT